MADADARMKDDDAPSVVASPMHDDIYACRKCGADIALCNSSIRKTLMKNYADFEEVDNVIARQTQENKDKFRIIYCELCEKELGGDRLHSASTMADADARMKDDVVVSPLQMADSVVVDPLHDCRNSGTDIALCNLSIQKFHSASKMEDASSAIFYNMHQDVYLCRNCGTDVCLRQQFLRKTLIKNYADFTTFWNIFSRPSTLEIPDQFTTVYCKGCSLELGAERRWVPQNNAHEGKYFIDLSTLALRKEMEYFDAVTQQRLDKNIQYTCWQMIKDSKHLKDLGEDEYLFDCRGCGNKLAANHEWVLQGHFFFGEHYIVFGNIQNVIYKCNAGVRLHKWDSIRSQTIVCGSCEAELGYKVLSVIDGQPEVSPGQSVLYTEMLRSLKLGKKYDAETGKLYSDQTFIMIKPDGVQRGLVGEIIHTLEKNGLKLKGLKFTTVERELKHYAHLSSAKKLNGVVRGPVVAMVWEGINAVLSVRNIIGGANPTDAAAFGTIGGDHAIDTTWNVIHASDGDENAKLEIGLWFPEGIIEWN